MDDQNVNSKPKRNWKKIVWRTAVVILGAYVILAIARIPHVLEKDKTDAAVAKIHATKLTLDDVMGKNLPPDPGADADKTVQGVDANHNGIRDDVELAILKLNPNSVRLRAAQLQFAMALQLRLAEDLSNGDIDLATSQLSDYGAGCIRGYFAPFYIAAEKAIGIYSWEKMRPLDEEIRKKEETAISEVKDLVFNTELRRSKNETISSRVTTIDENWHIGPACDAALFSLPN